MTIVSDGPCEGPAVEPTACMCSDDADKDNVEHSSGWGRARRPTGPVCGSDGVTYPSSCRARCAGACVEHPGPCEDPGACRVGVSRTLWCTRRAWAP